MPSFIRKLILKYDDYLSYDKIGYFHKLIRKYMRSEKPTVIYVHCSAGIDRTGYVSGSYKMKYYNSSLKEVMYENL